jgi:hypothetical protein
MDGLFDGKSHMDVAGWLRNHGKSHKKIWMMTGGSPKWMESPKGNL